MRAAGWVLSKRGDDHWEVVTPDNIRFQWRHGAWTPSLSELEERLKYDEQRVRDGKLSPFQGTARLLHSPGADRHSTLVSWITEQKRVRDETLLRVLTEPDPTGDDRLARAGARKVHTLQPPWPPAESGHRTFPYSLMLCDHGAEALPPSHRPRLYQNLRTHLHPEGEIFFCFYEISALPPEKQRAPLEDGYRVRHGLYDVFLKPYLPGQAEKELRHHLGGFVRTEGRRYDEFICRWRPDA